MSGMVDRLFSDDHASGFISSDVGRGDASGCIGIYCLCRGSSNCCPL